MTDLWPGEEAQASGQWPGEAAAASPAWSPGDPHGATMSAAPEPSAWDKIQGFIGGNDLGPLGGLKPEDRPPAARLGESLGLDQDKVGPTGVGDLLRGGAGMGMEALKTFGAAELPISMLEAGSIPAALGVLGRTGMRVAKGAAGAGAGAAVGGLAGMPFDKGGTGAKIGAEIGGGLAGIGGIGGLRGMAVRALLGRPEAAAAEAEGPGAVARLVSTLKSKVGEAADSFRPSANAVMSDGEASAAERLTPEVQASVMERLNRAGLVGPSESAAPSAGRGVPKGLQRAMQGSANEADEMQRMIDDQKLRMLTGSDAEASAAQREIARLERLLTTVGRQSARWAGRAAVE